MIYIDSSFLLCLLLKDPDWAYKFCEIMFKDIKTRKLPTAISIITLFETIGILTRRERWSTKETIKKISRIQEEIKPKVLDFRNGNLVEKTLANWGKYEECGFFDCCHYTIMKTYGINTVCSIDQDFDSFPNVTRIMGESEISL